MTQPPTGGSLTEGIEFKGQSRRGPGRPGGPKIIILLVAVALLGAAAAYVYIPRGEKGATVYRQTDPLNAPPAGVEEEKPQPASHRIAPPTR